MLGAHSTHPTSMVKNCVRGPTNDYGSSLKSFKGGCSLETYVERTKNSPNSRHNSDCHGRCAAWKCSVCAGGGKQGRLKTGEARHAMNSLKICCLLANRITHFEANKSSIQFIACLASPLFENTRSLELLSYLCILRPENLKKEHLSPHSFRMP